MTKLLFVDVETIGTNVVRGTAKKRKNHCMQIAIILTDLNLNCLYSEDIIVKTSERKLSKMEEHVRKMHTDTGLIERIKSSSVDKLHKHQVDYLLVKNISKYIEPGERLVAVGNNVQFDVEVIRQNFPELFVMLHHSVLDVSSIRRMVDLVSPGYGNKVKEAKESNHDAYVDIQECMKELKHYMGLLDLKLISDSEDEITF